MGTTCSRHNLRGAPHGKPTGLSIPPYQTNRKTSCAPDWTHSPRLVSQLPNNNITILNTSIITVACIKSHLSQNFFVNKFNFYTIRRRWRVGCIGLNEMSLLGLPCKKYKILPITKLFFFFQWRSSENAYFDTQISLDKYLLRFHYFT